MGILKANIIELKTYAELEMLTEHSSWTCLLNLEIEKHILKIGPDNLTYLLRASLWGRGSLTTQKTKIAIPKTKIIIYF